MAVNAADPIIAHDAPVVVATAIRVAQSTIRDRSSLAWGRPLLMGSDVAA